MIIPDALDEALKSFLSASDRQMWDRYDFDFTKVAETRPHPLEGNQIAAVKTALMIEDHIPGYGNEYMRLFPVDESVSPQEAWYNRQMIHFIFRWLSEEDRHAHVFELYLRETKAVHGQALTDEMIREGVKHYAVPHDDPCKLFIYTSLQEKATQLFYQCLRDSIHEPVLESILTKLAGEEARHCSFFGAMVKIELAQRGDELIKDLREALDAFKMPLADTLENYRRQAMSMTRTAKGYDYRQAFEHFGRMLIRQTEAAENSRTHQLHGFLSELISLGPRWKPTPT